MADANNNGLVRTTAQAALELHERVRDFADYRRSTTATQRLFRLPTEALLGVFGSSASGALLSVLFAQIDVVAAGAAALVAFPFVLLATASGPMLLYRYFASRNLPARGASLQLLDDEIRQASAEAGTPKEYVNRLYKLRASLLSDALARQDFVAPKDVLTENADVRTPQ